MPLRGVNGMTTRRQFNAVLLGAAAVAPLAACSTAPRAARVAGVDCHAHVFTRDLPMPDRRRAPAGYDATPEDYLRKLGENGITHGVLVQPSFLGTDNSYLVAALRKYRDRLRGIAVVDPDITRAELQALQDGGVVGIRLNLVGLPTPDFTTPAWRALLSELQQRRWQVEVHRAAGELAVVVDPLVAAGIDVVVDHFGRPNENAGIDDPGFRHLLALGPSRKVWVKLSGAYRNGPAGRGEATAVAAMPLLRSAFGLDRLVWGSDWPHTLFEKTVDYAAQRRLLETWLPDADDRRVVLRDTAVKLFGFA
jgi:predicted TIM-barrel fold metal-dependent hydrolase